MIKFLKLFYIIYHFIFVEGFLLVIGELSEEEEVLQWLITQKTEDRIELITRVMLEGLVEETQYLAVYFCKYIVEKDTHVSFIYRVIINDIYSFKNLF
jgi:hypothetical protein